MQKAMTYEHARHIVGNLAITDDPAVLKRDNRYILVDDVQDVIEAFVKDGHNIHEDEDIFMFLDRHGIVWE